METSDVMMDLGGVGALLVGIVTLCVAVLTLRSAQSAVHLAEARNEHLREEQIRLAKPLEQLKVLETELAQERLERWSLQEALNQEQGERLEAQRRVEQAEQEALKQTTRQLRERMVHYLKKVEEDTDPDNMRRVK
jgi:uncharacterized membrane protein YhiD involved in acid resistance